MHMCYTTAKTIHELKENLIKHTQDYYAQYKVLFNSWRDYEKDWTTFPEPFFQ